MLGVFLVILKDRCVITRKQLDVLHGAEIALFIADVTEGSNVITLMLDPLNMFSWSPNSPRHNLTNSTRLHLDTRERISKSTAPTATTDASGESPAPERQPGPQPPPAPVSHQKYNTYHTVA